MTEAPVRCRRSNSPRELPANGDPGRIQSRSTTTPAKLSATAFTDLCPTTRTPQHAVLVSAHATDQIQDHVPGDLEAIEHASEDLDRSLELLGDDLVGPQLEAVRPPPKRSECARRCRSSELMLLAKLTDCLNGSSVRDCHDEEPRTLDTERFQNQRFGAVPEGDRLAAVRERSERFRDSFPRSRSGMAALDSARAKFLPLTP